MPNADYDIAVVGGGICGSSIARVMAGAGARVLVLEQETRFRDRVRGEFVEPWGVAEVRALGLYDALVEGAGARPLPLLVTGAAGRKPRDLTATSVPRCPALSFCHPRAQEALLGAAVRAGAEVRRGVHVREVRPGSPPAVVVNGAGSKREITARLVVGADGRTSAVRAALGLDERTVDPARRITGVLLEGITLPEDHALIAMKPDRSLIAYLFPQGGGRARGYIAFRAEDHAPMHGERDLARLIEASVAAGAPAEFYVRARVGGPLATFDAAERWVSRPARDGVVLIGDAAGISDPSWGQGLSLGFRDVRVLRDMLLAGNDWDAAARCYAETHDRYFCAALTVVGWLRDFFLSVGPEAEERRARARVLAREDPSRVPDHMVSGPDLPSDETTRRRFFGEE